MMRGLGEALILLFWIAAVGVVAILGWAVWLIVWLVQNIRIEVLS